MQHTTDWKPGHVSKEYRDNYDRIFSNKEDKENSEDSACLECPRYTGPGCICDHTVTE